MWGSKQVATFVGVPYRTLDHWIRSGLLACEWPGNGTGNRRGWSAGDVTRAVVVNELRGYGYSVQTIRKSRILGRLTDEDITGGAIVCTVGNVIGVVPTYDPILEAKKRQWDSDFPITAAQFMTDHLSRDLPLDQQASVTIYVTDIYKEVLQRMKEQAEVNYEQ